MEGICSWVPGVWTIGHYLAVGVWVIPWAPRCHNHMEFYFLPSKRVTKVFSSRNHIPGRIINCRKCFSWHPFIPDDHPGGPAMFILTIYSLVSLYGY